MERKRMISMRYVISDIHGCYRQYRKLLDKIKFSQEDTLYVLGDMVDRGPEPIQVLEDMMGRTNVQPILGNHDYMAYKVLRKLNVDVTEKNAETHLNDQDILNYQAWIKEGGKVTVNQFRQREYKKREEILDYIRSFRAYEKVHCGQKTYILVHGGIHGFTEEKRLEDYKQKDFIFCRADYEKRYFQDKQTYLVTGHTPTFLIREDKKALVYEKYGHIAIDCGCVFQEKLAAYCLDTGTITYVDYFDCKGEKS